MRYSGKVFGEMTFELKPDDEKEPVLQRSGEIVTRRTRENAKLRMNLEC